MRQIQENRGLQAFVLEDQEKISTGGCSSQEEMARHASSDEGVYQEIHDRRAAQAQRSQNSNGYGFSWWDYRGGAWQHNKGMRIDYLLTSPLAADKIISATIEDRGVRDQEKASDHCPVCVKIEL